MYRGKLLTLKEFQNEVLNKRKVWVTYTEYGEDSPRIDGAFHIEQNDWGYDCKYGGVLYKDSLGRLNDDDILENIDHFEGAVSVYSCEKKDKRNRY